jgi:hypothetical protein
MIMKKFIIILFILNFQILFAQDPCSSYCLDFEDSSCLSHLKIDKTSYPQNIWQIGQSQKPGFDTLGNDNHVIMTDTLLSYPASNVSVFVITNIASDGDIYGCKMFSGVYCVQTDLLNDYGKLEFSADKGKTWIDIVNDTSYSKSFKWFSKKPVLTGNSGGWQYFDVLLADNGSAFNLKPGDTLLYRFTFISDSIPEKKHGLMFDDLCLQDFVVGKSETRFGPLKSKISPSGNLFTIEFDNPQSELFQLAVYDIHSILMMTRDNIPGNNVVIDGKLLKPGIYIYKLTNMKVPKRSWGKFIIK